MDSIKYFTFTMIGSILGICGILLNRQNILIISMLTESMLIAINLDFLVFSISLDDMMGQIICFISSNSVSCGMYYWISQSLRYY
uniref:NADH dehydrogenase subunit 4L n=1 Tax=Oryza brachyantha TaxID=4533 RepID=J3M8V7_ORYBR